MRVSLYSLAVALLAVLVLLGGVWVWGGSSSSLNMALVRVARYLPADQTLEVIDATGSTAGYAIVDPRDLHGRDFAEALGKIPDPSKAMRDLGWYPRRSRADCIRDALPVPA